MSPDTSVLNPRRLSRLVLVNSLLWTVGNGLDALQTSGAWGSPGQAFQVIFITSWIGMIIAACCVLPVKTPS